MAQTEPVLTRGSNHVRYVHTTQALRLTCDMPLTYVLDATSYLLDRPANLLFGVDETLGSGIGETARDFEERTAHYWQHWVRALAVPLEWQDAVIRAAITLKLCTYEETGAIIAAMTTSIPEAPGTERTWDYRYCWLRDAFFVIRALNGISEVATMESYLRYLFNVVHTATARGHLQPVYGIGLEADLGERTVDTLPGFRGIGPVRVGNQAYEHQPARRLRPRHARLHAGVLRPPAAAAGGPRRLHPARMAGRAGLRAVRPARRGHLGAAHAADVHTSSAIMCWAACDRLAKIAAHLGLDAARERRGRPAATRCARPSSSAAGATSARRLSPPSAATRSMQACC